MRIEIESKGSFQKTEKFLNRLKKGDIFDSLERYGLAGAVALASVTPVDTGETASSWYWTVAKKNNVYWLIWRNSHVEAGQPVAILLQYGHGTGTGGYVQGRDYINPAIRPIFDQIANEVWKVVTSA